MLTTDPMVEVLDREQPIPTSLNTAQNLHQAPARSEFGKKVVAEMNRLGILVDISHVSDSTFYQVLGYSKVPPI